jgi:RNA polymerase sigma-70 factor (ECF subfamily)
MIERERERAWDRVIGALSLLTVAERIYEGLSDIELARLARDGDDVAFEEIVRLYSPRVFRVASQFFRRREMVEDAAQESFLKAYTQLGSYEGRGSFEGWLARITTNVCLNILRAAKRRPESTLADLTADETRWLDQRPIDASNPRPASAEDKVVAADLAEKLLEVLAPEDRALLIWIDGDELSVKEAAELTGWSQSKVKVRAMRARRRLRRAVEKLLGKKEGKAGAGRK